MKFPIVTQAWPGQIMSQPLQQPVVGNWPQNEKECQSHFRYRCPSPLFGPSLTRQERLKSHNRHAGVRLFFKFSGHYPCPVRRTAAPAT